MKKVALLTLLLIVAMVSIAAAPAPTAKRPMCYNPRTGDMVPCPFTIKSPYQGEPTMEKVTASYVFVHGRNRVWVDTENLGYWYGGCGKNYYRLYVYLLPVGCNFRYQY